MSKTPRLVEVVLLVDAGVRRTLEPAGESLEARLERARRVETLLTLIAGARARLGEPVELVLRAAGEQPDPRAQSTAPVSMNIVEQLLQLALDGGDKPKYSADWMTVAEALDDLLPAHGEMRAIVERAEVTGTNPGVQVCFHGDDWRDLIAAAGAQRPWDGGDEPYQASPHGSLEEEDGRRG